MIHPDSYFYFLNLVQKACVTTGQRSAEDRAQALGTRFVLRMRSGPRCRVRGLGMIDLRLC